MTRRWCVRNRQRTWPVNVIWLRRIGKTLLEEDLHRAHYEICVHLVSDREMTHLNREFLRHEGSTDVITFDHRPVGEGGQLYGEIFICLDVTVSQARIFRCPWPTELVRYLIHGLLHLDGYEDGTPGSRKIMKRRENRLLKSVARRFDLRRLAV